MNKEYKYIIGVWIFLENLGILKDKFYILDIYDEGMHIDDEENIIIEEISELNDGIKIELVLTTTNPKLIQAYTDNDQKRIYYELKKELNKHDFIKHYRGEMLERIYNVCWKLESELKETCSNLKESLENE